MSRYAENNDILVIPVLDSSLSLQARAACFFERQRARFDTVETMPELQRLQTLARISHLPTTATVPCHALWAFYSVRVLDIVSRMPAGPLVVKPIQDASFNRLATKSGEKCGLAIFMFEARVNDRCLSLLFRELD